MSGVLIRGLTILRLRLATRANPKKPSNEELLPVQVSGYMSARISMQKFTHLSMHMSIHHSQVHARVCTLPCVKTQNQSPRSAPMPMPCRCIIKSVFFQPCRCTCLHSHVEHRSTQPCRCIGLHNHVDVHVFPHLHKFVEADVFM